MQRAASTPEPAAVAPLAAAVGLEAMILAADIGPTTAHVALFDVSGRRLLRVESFRTGEHESVAALLARFFDTASSPQVEAAAVGVSFPLPVFAHELAEVFEIPTVVVLDGLEAGVHRLRDLARLGAERLVSAPREKAMPRA